MPYQLVRKVILSVDILVHDLQLQVLESSQQNNMNHH